MRLSLGLAIKLAGKTAHAATSQDGLSPARSVAGLIPALSDLGVGGKLNGEFKLATITHVSIGEPAFGIAPGGAVVHVTLRTARIDALSGQVSAARHLATATAGQAGLGVTFEICDGFAASINNPDAIGIAQKSMNGLGIANSEDGLPMRASEDFGVFGRRAKAAMPCLGAGLDHPALHSPEYDFPDDLIPVGATILIELPATFLDRRNSQTVEFSYWTASIKRQQRLPCRSRRNLALRGPSRIP